MRLITTLAALAFTLAPAAAQTIEIGSDDLIKRTVEQAGYDSVRITERQLTIVRTEACKGDKKYRVKVSILGKITSEERRGDCDLRPAKKKRAEKPRNVQASQLPRILERQGYNRIEIVDGNLPRYLVEACREGRRFSLALNERGRVYASERIGNCRRQARQPEAKPEPKRKRIDVATIPDILEEQGFDRVRMLRSNRAPYLAEACRNNRLIEVRLNRFGDIIKRDRIGRCEDPLTVEDVQATLEKSGLMQVNVKQRGRRGFTAEVCRDAERYALNISGRGNVRDERRIGTCSSQSVLNVLQTLETRGASKTEAFVEGCFQGDRFRWSFDRLGNRTARKRIGNC